MPQTEQRFLVRPFRFILPNSSCLEVWSSVPIISTALSYLGQMPKASFWLSGQAHLSTASITNFRQKMSWLKSSGRNCSSPLLVIFLNLTLENVQCGTTNTIFLGNWGNLILPYNKEICLSYTGSAWHRKPLGEIWSIICLFFSLKPKKRWTARVHFLYRHLLTSIKDHVAFC